MKETDSTNPVLYTVKKKMFPNVGKYNVTIRENIQPLPSYPRF